MSTCRTIKEKLVLYCYDELSDTEQAELEAHLKVCSACQEELAALQKLQADVKSFSVSNDILQPTRRALFYKLRNMSAKEQPSSPWWNIGKLALQAGLAIVLVFFGFKLGKNQSQTGSNFAIKDLLTASRTISVDDGSISPLLVGIDKITFSSDGAVEISYNTLNKIHIQGYGNDPAIQHMLHYALLTDDPIARLRAVKALEKLASMNKKLDDSYFTILQRILNQETNIGVKLTVIDILGTVQPQPQVQDILVNAMLADDNQAVRLQAFKALLGGEYQIAALENVLTITKSDSNTYIRTKSLELLNKSKGTSL
ncbi:zf-HC2 domain-containing protein [candidate division KSB1 bacterium]|nr:zf-HC2 domain-containing protein [candidate division KSB1 bacterium]